MASNGHFCSRDYRSEKHEFHYADPLHSQLDTLAAHLNTNTTTDAQLLRNESKFRCRSHFNAKLPCTPKQYTIITAVHERPGNQLTQTELHRKENNEQYQIVSVPSKWMFLYLGTGNSHIQSEPTIHLVAPCSRTLFNSMKSPEVDVLVFGHWIFTYYSMKQLYIQQHHVREFY